MAIDAEAIKAANDIVEVIGKFVDLKPEGSGMKGLCPFHEEKTPSFNVMAEGQFYKCHGGCGAQGDVIHFIREFKNLDFKAACEFLGGDIPEGGKPKPRPKQKKKKLPPPVPLNYEDAKNHYTQEIMQDRADFIFKDPPRKFKKAWAYKNEDGLVELVACRFECEKGSKKALSMYWNGKTIKLAGYPVLLFNRDRLKNEPEKPVLLVEGEPSVEAAAKLTDFIPVTWNGGGAKTKDVDWSPLKNREVFIYPDDDQKHYMDGHPRAGQLLPPHEQPGNKAAAAIKKKLPHAKIVKPLIEARKIKKSGADIVEALAVMSVEGLTAYIIENAAGNNISAAANEKKTENQQDKVSAADDINAAADRPPPDSTLYPFKILGIADDGRAYIIGCNERLYPFNPMSFTKAQLYNLADLEYWQGAYEYLGTGGKMWDQAISDLVQAVNVADFDVDIMRGRGAWREPDGRICYHDGRNTVGEYSKERVYLRRIEMKIGISGKQATAAERNKVCEIAKELTFTTMADCVRTLGWSVLSPFAGALPWRPAGLLTAASGTGKSTIVDYIVKPLSVPIICSGGDSTAVGIRQKAGVDSRAIVVEESETDTQKKKQNRDDTFSLMRQSTSDNSPDVLKGTIDGKGISFKLRSMFFFVSISPEVESEADENRIFRVGLKKPSDTRSEWIAKKKKLKEILTPEVCNRIRAYTWSHLKEIIELADRVAIQAQIVAGADNRTAFAESLLLAAYIAVFKNKPDASVIFINDFVKEFYALAPLEPRRNENEEMVDILLDSIIRGDSSHSYTMREILGAIETGKIYCEDIRGEDGHVDRQEQPMDRAVARRLAGMYGMGLAPDGNIAIAINHHEVRKMLNKGKGYHQQLKRHPRLVEVKNVSLGSRNTKGCVVIEWDRDADAT